MRVLDFQVDLHYDIFSFHHMNLDVSEDLARRMKNEYECASCFEHREVLEREVV